MFLGYTTVLTGIMIHLFCGNMYLWGNVNSYVVTHFHYLGDKNATTANAVVVFPLMLTCQSLTNPIGAYLQKRYNPKVIISVGLSMMCCAILGAALSTSWFLFVFFMGVLYPMGIGMVYWIPICCGWEWFPERKGLISGLIIGGYGFGAFIFDFVSNAIANPNDFKPEVPGDGSTTDLLMPRSVGDAVPRMYLICLACWFCLGLTAVFGVFRNPEYIRKEKLRTRHETLKDKP
jgi:OFA family oxalate/formate antiporter-like MFS transporter